MRITTYSLLYSLLLLCSIGCRKQEGREYRIGIVAAGGMDKSMKQQTLAACRHLLDDTLRNVALIWLDDTLALSKAYYAPRNRYRALELLDQEKVIYRKHDDSINALIAITDLPISATGHGVYDYGICGLSYLGGRVSIASRHHIDGDLFIQNIRHEWGHAAAGIPHCQEPGCIMNDAKGKMKNLYGHNKFGKDCYRQAYNELVR